MKQFKPFPIFANDPGPELEKNRQRLKRDFAAKRDRQMMRWLDDKLPLINEVTPSARPTDAQRNYEKAVIGQIAAVYSNPIGKIVIEQLDLIGEEVWIIPMETESTKDCECGAMTFPGDPKARGGYRIYYDPKWDLEGNKWIGSDDILLHELVHAFRMARVGYFNQKEKPLRDFENGEEFIATQVQNVYLGFGGSSFFYKTYSPLTRASKAEVYNYYTENEDILAAFRYFLDNDRLARIIARWPSPQFNPFRDFGQLNNTYLDYMRSHGFNSNYHPY